MPDPTPPSLSLVAAFDLLRNKKPQELTADEVAGLRARLQADPSFFASAGGVPAVERFLAETEAALEAAQREASENPRSPTVETAAPIDRRAGRRKIEIVIYALIVLAAAGGLFAFLRQQKDPTAPVNNKDTAAKSKKSVAAIQTTGASTGKAKDSQAETPADTLPDDNPAEDIKDPNIWLGWKVERTKPATADKKQDWDRIDPSNPVPAVALFVSGGPLRLTRSTAIRAEDKWLMVLARPVTATVPGGQIVVTIDGQEAAKATIGAGESDWPMYVPLTDSHQAKRQLEIVFTPGVPQQQIIFWNVQLTDSQETKRYPESPLISALRSADAAERARGATAAGQVFDPLAVGAIVHALSDPSRDVRRAAATALVKYNDATRPFVTAALIEKLRDADPEVCRAAAQSLVALNNEKTWVALADVMASHPDLHLRLQIASQLAAQKHPAIRAAFAKLLDSPEDPLRLAALNAVVVSNDPQGAALLLRALKDPNRDVRRTALAHLGRFSAGATPATVEALLAQLRGNDPEFRQLAAQTLLSFDTENTWVALSQMMTSHPDLPVRRQIAAMLAGRKHPTVLAAFTKLLDDPDDALRQAVVSSMVANPDPAVVPLLVRAMADPEPTVRRTAASALVARPGDAAEDALISALTSHPDMHVRRAAILRFHRLPTAKALPALRAAAQGPDGTFKRLVPQALAKLPGDEVDAILVQLYNAPDYATRFAALVEGLAYRKGPVAEAIVLKAIPGDDAAFRECAIRRLSMPELVTPQAIPPLREALKSPSAFLRGEVFDGVRNARASQLKKSNLAALSSPPWNETMELIISGLDDPVIQVRAKAADALRLDPHPDANIPLPRLMASQDLLLRRLAAGRYSHNAPRSEKSFEFYKLCLKDSDPVVRATGAQGLVAFRSREAADLLAIAGDDSDVRVRAIVQTARHRNPAAVQDEALLPAEAKAGTEQARAVLIKLLNDPKPSVRYAAIQRLSQSLDPAVEQTALQIVSSHSDLQVRRVAAQIVARKAPTPDTMETVRTLLRDPDSVVRETALDALSQAPTPETIVLAAGLLKDPVFTVRMKAASQLCAMESAAGDEQAIALLHCQEWPLRQAAIQRFARVPSPRAAEALGAAVAAPELQLSLEALLALAKVPGPAAIGPLVRTLEHPVYTVRQTAADMLRGRIEPESVSPMLSVLASHPEIGMRISAAQKFESQSNPGALGPLLAAAKHPDDVLRATATRALGRLNDAGATAALSTALSDPIPEVYMAAVNGLLARRDDGAEGALIAALANHPQVEVRHVAATRFHQLPTPKALPALAASLKDPDDRLRLLAAQALQKLPVESLDLLIAALSDPNEQVRGTALATLASSADPKAQAAVTAFKARTQTP